MVGYGLGMYGGLGGGMGYHSQHYRKAKPAQLLQEAATILYRDGWVPKRDRRGTALTIEESLMYALNEFDPLDVANRAAFVNARTALTSELSTPNISDWEQVEGRTQEEVCRALRRCASRYPYYKVAEVASA